jgi:uncharacterized protein YndB with AHSA1/START domain
MTRLIIETPGETQIVLRRVFAAPHDLVYRAHVDAALIPRWMNIMPGWTMPVAESDPRPGGTFRFRWDDGEGGGFRIEGEFLEVEPGRRILHVERMYLPDPTPDNRVETLFEPLDGGTRLVMTMALPDAATRRSLLRSGMTDGLEMTYARLDALLAGDPAP